MCLNMYLPLLPSSKDIWWFANKMQIFFFSVMITQSLRPCMVFISSAGALGLFTLGVAIYRALKDMNQHTCHRLLLGRSKRMQRLFILSQFFFFYFCWKIHLMRSRSKLYL